MIGVVRVKVSVRRRLRPRIYRKLTRLVGRKFTKSRNGARLFKAELTAGEYRKLQRLSRSYPGIRYMLDNSFSGRGRDYRQRFIEKNPPYLGGRYFCSYCGKLIKLREMTVDHLYPVKKGSRSVRLQKKLKRAGFKDINDIRNLVPACEACNKKKGTKTGRWILRGRIGRNRWYWQLRWSLKMILIAAVLSAISWLIVSLVLA